MVKCTKGQVRWLKTALRWKIPPGSVSASRWCCCARAVDAAFDCRGNGCVAEHGEPGALAYDHGGLKALKPRPSGGRKYENMTLAEEKALLARFAKAAGAGEMLNIHDLKAAYEKAIGHETSQSTIYNLLARHGWRKLMPRPFHPRRDIAAQNAFKKMAFQML